MKDAIMKDALEILIKEKGSCSTIQGLCENCPLHGCINDENTLKDAISLWVEKGYSQEELFDMIL